MAFGGRPMRVGVGCQFMVDPNLRHGLTALQLARAALSAPQDLFIADGANDFSRQILTGLGGTTPLLYNLHWTRPLRPARYALSLLEERCALPRALTLPARSLGALVAALAARLRPNRLNREEVELKEGALAAAAILPPLPDLIDRNAPQPPSHARSLACLPHHP